MTVESVAEFSLWPSFAAADSIEADTAAAAAAVGLLGGGNNFAAMRTNDVSPFSRMSDQSQQLGLDVAGSMATDQLFHSAEAANTAELFAILQLQQQQQQQPQSSTDEQSIDAEISRLLQMKQALHRQQQQPLGQGQATAAPILEDEPFMAQQSQLAQTMQTSGSGSSGGAINPAVSLSLDQSLPMDCLLTPAQSATLDISQDWAWATGAAAAARVAAQPMRHSIDLGGLTHRMAAFDIGAGSSSNSFSTTQPSCSFSTTQQQLAMGSNFAAQQSMAAAAAAAAASAAAAAAALSAASGPFCGGGLAGGSGLPPAGAGLAGNQLAASQLAGNQLAGNQLALQSGLYMPAPNASRLSMEQPAMPQMPQAAAAFGMRPAPVNRIPTGRMSLDVTACSSLYSTSAAPMGVGAGVQQMGLTGAQAAWLSNAAVGAANRAVSSIHTNQLASIDIPLSRTPDGRCPPRKTASVVSTGSARDSPTQQAAGRKSATFSAEDRPGNASGAGGRSSGRSGPVHQAPKWAGSHWHPMADVVKSGQIANKGTGVFIPGGVKASAS